MAQITQYVRGSTCNHGYVSPENEQMNDDIWLAERAALAQNSSAAPLLEQNSHLSVIQPFPEVVGKESGEHTFAIHILLDRELVTFVFTCFLRNYHFRTTTYSATRQNEALRNLYPNAAYVRNR